MLYFYCNQAGGGLSLLLVRAAQVLHQELPYLGLRIDRNMPRKCGA